MGEVQPYSIEMYITRTGIVPFEEWLQGLRDARARGRIRARLARVRLGNLGQAHAVGGGAVELQSDSRPGYRVYHVHSGTGTPSLSSGGHITIQASRIP